MKVRCRSLTLIATLVIGFAGCSGRRADAPLHGNIEIGLGGRSIGGVDQGVVEVLLTFEAPSPSPSLTDVDLALVLWQEGGERQEIKRNWAEWPSGETKVIEVPPKTTYEKCEVRGAAMQGGKRVRINVGHTRGAKGYYDELDVQFGGATKAALPQSGNTPNGVRIWRDTEAEEFCKWLRIEADCFKFEGGWIDCQVEIDVGGKKEVREWGAPFTHQKAGQGSLFDDPVVGKPSGAFLWIRRFDEQDACRLAFRYSAKTANGETSASSSSRDFTDLLPQPSEKGKERLVRGDAEVRLNGDEVVTLVTVLTEGEQKGEITRTVKLQCKAVK